MKLRTLLVLLVLSISGAGLATSSTVVESIMKDYIYSKVDEDLDQALNGWAGRQELLTGSAVSTLRPPSAMYVMKIRDDGTYILNDSDSSPDLTQLHSSPQTVPAASNSPNKSPWRVMLGKQGSTTTIVGRSLEKENWILGRLARVQLVIGLLVLLVVAVVGLYSVRRALRPLREVEATASAIASGDLDRRVPNDAAMAVEVASLATSFNVMLGQLQESIVSAQEKEQQMRRFVGDASHELRTPLTSVRGYAELYRSGATQDADMVIDKIEAEAGRMSLLVEDLLALTRSESTLVRKPVDVLDEAMSVASSLRVAYGGQLDVENTCETCPVVSADPAQIHRILTNLVSNAFIHGGDHVLIQVSCDDTTVRVTVADNGGGVPDKDLDHVFERFYRSDESRTRASGGSGLGLAIVQSLAVAHGGEVTVHNDTDGCYLGGAVFELCLPTSY